MKFISVDRSSVYAQLMAEAKRKIVLEAIAQACGNCSEAAIRLGVHRNTIVRLLQEMGLKAVELKKYGMSVRPESEVRAIA